MDQFEGQVQALDENNLGNSVSFGEGDGGVWIVVVEDDLHLCLETTINDSSLGTNSK